jgi:hypothetical protein
VFRWTAWSVCNRRYRKPRRCRAAAEEASTQVKIEVPAGHQVGMKVTKGGSSCANCKFLRPGLKCANTHFQDWNGSDKIPTKAADEYCSDFWEPAPEKRKTLGDQLRSQKENKR